ncbi:MAG: hypothetical protein AB8G15_00445 [Saprospiraceae bacterium]
MKTYKMHLNFIYGFCFFLLSSAWNLPTVNAAVIYSAPLKGKEFQMGNMLKWRTSEEINSQLFIIEKSTDGVSFDELGVVNAAGLSEKAKGYRFLDSSVDNDKAFYRLKQVDTDGTASFSQIVIVKRSIKNQFMVVAMTNTTTNDNFKVTLDALKEGQLEYTLSNLKGEVISTGKKVLTNGLVSLDFSLADEQEGIYKISLNLEEEVETLVIRKIDDEIKKKQNVASKKQEKGG